MANGQGSDWPELKKLWADGASDRTAVHKEAWRRDVLRAAMTDTPALQDIIGLRMSLDRELERLAKEELQFEIGNASHITGWRQPANYLRDDVSHFTDLLRDSAAFRQYLSVKLYFGVRFAAGRMGKEFISATADLPNGKGGVGLPPPPDLGTQHKSDVDKFLKLENSPCAAEALKFLDVELAKYVAYTIDGTPHETDKKSATEKEIMEFDLWLRGLAPQSANEERFGRIANGLYEWAVKRYSFYVDLERTGHPKRVGLWKVNDRVEGEWHAHNPLAARCGVVDLFWLAKVLSAEVSARCVVRYPHHSWLRCLPNVQEKLTNVALIDAKLSKRDFKQLILRMEDVLGAVFYYACELIENAVDIAEYKAKKLACPDDYPNRISGSLDWRAVQDDEIAEIRLQRASRFYSDHPLELLQNVSGEGSPEK
jgi:hypothetical protein